MWSSDGSFTYQRHKEMSYSKKKKWRGNESILFKVFSHERTCGSLLLREVIPFQEPRASMKFLLSLTASFLNFKVCFYLGDGKYSGVHSSLNFIAPWIMTKLVILPPPPHFGPLGKSEIQDRFALHKVVGNR